MVTTIAVKLAICALAPDKPARDATAPTAKFVIAAPAIVSVPPTPFNDAVKLVMTLGKVASATCACIPALAINIMPMPAACIPGPAVAIPDAAMPAKPAATDANVAATSPSGKAVKVEIPCAINLTPIPAFLAELPMLSKIPATPSSTVRMELPNEVITFDAPLSTVSIAVPSDLNRVPMLLMIGLI